MDEPLLPADAKKLAIDALARGTVIFDAHVRERMAERKISLVDVVRVIRAGGVPARDLRERFVALPDLDAVDHGRDCVPSAFAVGRGGDDRHPPWAVKQ